MEKQRHPENYFFHSKENKVEGKQLLTVSGSFKQFLFLYQFFPTSYIVTYSSDVFFLYMVSGLMT